jgi:hypothetical protein
MYCFAMWRGSPRPASPTPLNAEPEVVPGNPTPGAHAYYFGANRATYDLLPALDLLGHTVQAALLQGHLG